jgi:transcriptional regulator with XRE-family HTH domain
MTLPEIVDGLINLAGISTQEAAQRAGVSPGTVAGLRARLPTQVVTWCRMAAALGCSLAVTGRARAWGAELPRPAAPQVERAWQAWRQRRLISARHSVALLKERLRSAQREERAHHYVTNEEERLRARLAGLAPAIRGYGSRQHAGVEGLRQALREVATAHGITAEELSLLAGVHLAAAQHALGEENDGRLVTLHRLLSALEVQLRLELPGGGSIALATVPPGPWKPGSREEAPAPKRAAGESLGPANRSRLDPTRILALYDAEQSIGAIARAAGISRQRVHRIAMDHGRPPRRALAKERRIAAGKDVLG